MVDINAVVESFFAALKNELVYRSVFVSRAQARRATFEYASRSTTAGAAIARSGTARLPATRPCNAQAR
jgi:transposase InsO family protein